MDQVLGSLKKYLKETLKVNVETRPWKNQSKLPFFLIDSYRFYETSLLGHPSLLMIAQENADITPGMIQKHSEHVQKNWNEPIIYVHPLLSSYNRKRLIELHIPFIIPGNQMYLPLFGIDFREYFRKMPNKKTKAFSPGTQTMVIYALLNKPNEKLTASTLAEKLGYTLMTMTRAFNELKIAGVGESFREGRERFWTFSNKQSLWEQAKPFLRNPIKKRVWIKKHPLKTLAGLSALSNLSELAPPPIQVFAVGPDQWETLKQSGTEELPWPERSSLELEIWHYNPELFAKNGFVDPFSLYFSLEKNVDERVSSALEEMVEKIKW